jgi:tetratricopeptide (TPR) repeat protein
MTAVPDFLVRRLAEGAVVPFVGAGVPMAIGPTQFPSWRELVAKLIEALRAEGKMAAADAAERHMAGQHLLEAAQIARSALGGVRFDAAMRRLIPTSRPSDADLSLPRAIMDLRTPLTISTNYDDVLQWASNVPVRTVCNDGPGLAAVLGATATAPVVWHLHGRIDRPDTIVLGRDDYARTYSGEDDAVETATRAVLRSVLAGRVLMYVGFSLTDDAVVEQISYVVRRFQEWKIPGYALVSEADTASRERIERSLGIDVIAFRAHGAPLVERLRELRIRAFGERASGVRQLRSPLPSFVGRRAELERLTAVAGTGKGSLVVIRGAGGVGKTELAAEFAERSSRHASVAWWFDASSRGSLMAGVRDLFRRLGLLGRQRSRDAELLARFRDWMNSTDGWLVVLDDVRDGELLALMRPAQSSRGILLLTTRDPAIAADAPALQLAPMRRDDSVALLGGRPDADMLAERLGDLPLALGVAFKYAVKTGTSYAALLKRLALYPKHVLPSVYAYLEPSFEQVEAESERASHLLQMLAFVAPQPLARDLLPRGGGFDGSEAEANLLPDAIATDDAIRVLRQFGLIDTREDDTVVVHPLVQEAVRHRLTLTQREVWGNIKVVYWTRQVLTRLSDDGQVARVEHFVPHAAAALSHIDPRSAGSQLELVNTDHVEPGLGDKVFQLYPVMYLANEVAQHYADRGDAKEAATAWQKAIEAAEAISPDATRIERIIMGRKRALQLGEIKDPEALGAAIDAIALSEENIRAQPGDDSTKAQMILAMTLNDAGVVGLALDDLDAAGDWLERALRTSRAIGDRRTVRYAKLLDNIGKVHQERANRAEDARPDALLRARRLANRYFTIAVRLREKALDASPSDVAIGRYNLARVRFELGDVESAAALLRQALPELRRDLGQRQPLLMTRALLLAVDVAVASGEQRSGELWRHVEEHCAAPASASIKAVRLLHRQATAVALRGERSWAIERWLVALRMLARLDGDFTEDLLAVYGSLSFLFPQTSEEDVRGAKAIALEYAEARKGWKVLERQLAELKARLDAAGGTNL